MRIAFVDNAKKLILNVVVYDDGSEIKSGAMLESDAIAAGYKWEKFPDPVPVSVPKWAFLLTLRKRGKEDAFKAAIAAYNGANADRVRAKWDADPDIERNGATINALGAAIGYTPEQVDDLFRESQRVEAGQ